jgi:hypothetical protein
MKLAQIKRALANEQHATHKTDDLIETQFKLAAI